MLERLPDTPRAIGHRLAHGGPAHLEPARVDAPLLADLHHAIPSPRCTFPPSPPRSRLLRERFRTCLRSPASTRRPIAASFEEAGIRRYGFHGLSYEYLAMALAPLPARAIFAHL